MIELPPLPTVFTDDADDIRHYAEIANARERILMARIAELETALQCASNFLNYAWRDIPMSEHAFEFLGETAEFIDAARGKV